MRVLIVLCLMLDFGIAHAAQNKFSTGPTILKVSVVNRYGVKDTEIAKDGASWICKTEQNPYFVSHGAPYTPASLEAILKLRSKAAIPASCRDTVTIVDFGGRDQSPRRGCATEVPFKGFLRALSKNCGRTI